MGNARIRGGTRGEKSGLFYHTLMLAKTYIGRCLSSEAQSMGIISRLSSLDRTFNETLVESEIG